MCDKDSSGSQRIGIEVSVVGKYSECAIHQRSFVCLETNTAPIFWVMLLLGKDQRDLKTISEAYKE